MISLNGQRTKFGGVARKQRSKNRILDKAQEVSVGTGIRAIRGRRELVRRKDTRIGTGRVVVFERVDHGLNDFPGSNTRIGPGLRYQCCERPPEGTQECSDHPLSTRRVVYRFQATTVAYQ